MILFDNLSDQDNNYWIKSIIKEGRVEWLCNTCLIHMAIITSSEIEVNS